MSVLVLKVFLFRFHTKSKKSKKIFSYKEFTYIQVSLYSYSTLNVHIHFDQVGIRNSTLFIKSFTHFLHHASSCREAR